MKTVLLFLSALLLQSLADRCDDGPGYWCQSCDTVSECSHMLPNLLSICISFEFIRDGQCNTATNEHNERETNTFTATDWNEYPTTGPHQTEPYPDNYKHEKEQDVNVDEKEEKEIVKEKEKMAEESDKIVIYEGKETEIIKEKETEVIKEEMTDVEDETVTDKEKTKQKVEKGTKENKEIITGEKDNKKEMKQENIVKEEEMKDENAEKHSMEREEQAEQIEITEETKMDYEGEDMITKKENEEIEFSEVVPTDSSDNHDVELDKSKPATCSIFGRGSQHVLTYDRVSYSVQGNCFYVLSLDCDGTRDWIIYGQFAECGQNSTCLSAVSVFYKNMYLNLDRGWTVHYYGEAYKLVLKQEMTFRQGIKLYFDGLYIRVSLPNDVVVYWNGLDSFNIRIPGNMDGTCGLCGSNDAIRTNDLMTRSNELTKDIPKFVHSWKVDRLDLCSMPSVADNNDMVCGGKHRNEGAMECQRIFSDTMLKNCERHLNKKWFITKCVEDWCNAQQSFNEEIQLHDKIAECSAMATYVKRCNLDHVTNASEFWWRKNTGCPNTEETQDFTLLESIAPWHDAYDGVRLAK